MDHETTNKTEFWKKHVAGATAHPVGVEAYLKDHDLRPATYYGWRKFIKDEESKRKISFKGKPSIKEKSTRSLFLPVAISDNAFKMEQIAKKNLPEAQWVADVMLHLIRGLS